MGRPSGIVMQVWSLWSREKDQRNKDKDGDIIGGNATATVRINIRAQSDVQHKPASEKSTCRGPSLHTARPRIQTRTRRDRAVSMCSNASTVTTVRAAFCCFISICANCFKFTMRFRIKKWEFSLKIHSKTFWFSQSQFLWEFIVKFMRLHGVMWLAERPPASRHEKWLYDIKENDEKFHYSFVDRVGSPYFAAANFLKMLEWFHSSKVHQIYLFCLLFSEPLYASLQGNNLDVFHCFTI